MIEKNPANNELFSKKRYSILIAKMTELRKKSLISQSKVSKMIGLKSHGSINLIESNHTIPRLDSILKILSVYGYTLEIVKKEDVDD